MQQTSAGTLIGIPLNIMLLVRAAARRDRQASEYLMLQTNMLQSDRTRAPMAGQSDQAEGGGIGELVNFAATIIATTTTPVTASPMLAKPDPILCCG
jgi:hypothetical protein